jgi:glycosyltransferase involved in cell wall biosynthesis
MVGVPFKKEDYNNFAVVGCHGDWHTTDIAEALLELGRLSRYVTSQPKRRFPPQLRPFIKHLWSFRWAALLLRLPWWSCHMFENDFLFSEYQRFDRSYAEQLTGKEKVVFAWASMARRTISKAKSYGGKSILIAGNSHILIQKQAYELCSYGRQTVEQCWIDAQLEEYDLCDGILVESNYVKNGFVSNGISSEKIYILPPHCLPIYGKTTKRKFIFGAIQCNQRKGTHLLLDWWAKLNLTNAQLWLIGGQWDKDLIDISEIPSGVKVLGFLRKNQYQRKLVKLDVLLCPTYEDGGPKSLFQAMAAGVCPITSERCAGPDHISNGRNGFLIPLNDHDKWMETMRWCYNNCDRVRQMGISAQNYVKQHLSVNDHPMKLNHILEQLCGLD